MLIAVRGVQTKNKGAELLFRAIVAQRHLHLAGHEFAVDYWSIPRDLRDTLHVRGLAGFRRRRFQSMSAGVFNSVPKSLLGPRGLVSDSDIGAYFDASGFAYSDQHGPVPTETAAALAEQAKTSGKKTILLPQAFGPFRQPKTRQAMIRVLGAADLIFPRDRTSLQALLDIAEQPDKIILAPDFTVLLDGTAVESPMLLGGSVCLVPNHRMLEKTSSAIGKAYKDFLTKVADYLENHEIPYFVLIHDSSGKDATLLPFISNDADKVPIVEEKDPLKLKALLRDSMLVVGSRFHALVSALSQGTPAVGTSWSHKYEELYNEYGCPECLVDLGDVPKAVARFVETLSNIEHYRRTLPGHALEQKRRSNEMWRTVAEAINTPS